MNDNYFKALKLYDKDKFLDDKEQKEWIPPLEKKEENVVTN